MSVFSHSLSKLSSDCLSVGASHWANIIPSRHLLLIMKAFNETNKQLQDARYPGVNCSQQKQNKTQKKTGDKNTQGQTCQEAPQGFKNLAALFPFEMIIQIIGFLIHFLSKRR